MTDKGVRKSYEFESSESNGPPQALGPLRQRTRGPGFRRARQRGTRLRAACMLALVTPLLWSPSSVLYTELAPQQSTTTARTSCSTVLQSSEGPARSTAELAVVGVVVGTKAHLSAIHRRSFPSLKLATPSMDEGDVASSFVPGTVRAGRHRTLRSTLAFIPPTAGRECSLRHR